MKRKSTEGKTGEHMLLPQGELHLQMQKLIYDYLISQGLTATARSLTKEISSDSKYFKSIYCPDNLPLVYKTYLNVKEISRTCINDTSGPPFEPVSDQQEQESSEANKEKSDKQPRRKRKKSDADGGGDDRADVSSSQNVAMVSSSSSPANTRLPPPPNPISSISGDNEKDSSSIIPSKSLSKDFSVNNGAPLLASTSKSSSSSITSPVGGKNDSERSTSVPSQVSEYSQKQYSFSWRRYVDYCRMNNLDPLVSKGNSVGDQILGFAKLLLRHPEKSVKPAVANSYISAIGKKLLEEKVIDSMKEIRTTKLKELFADVYRETSTSSAGVNAGAAVVSTGTQATFLSVSKRSCSVGTSTLAGKDSVPPRETTGSSASKSTSTTAAQAKVANNSRNAKPSSSSSKLTVTDKSTTSDKSASAEGKVPPQKSKSTGSGTNSS